MKKIESLLFISSIGIAIDGNEEIATAIFMMFFIIRGINSISRQY